MLVHQCYAALIKTPAATGAVTATCSACGLATAVMTTVQPAHVSEGGKNRYCPV